MPPGEWPGNRPPPDGREAGRGGGAPAPSRNRVKQDLRTW